MALVQAVSYALMQWLEQVRENVRIVVELIFANREGGVAVISRGR